MTAAFLLAGIILFVIVILFARWSGWHGEISKQIDLFKLFQSQSPDSNEYKLVRRLIKNKIKEDPSNPSLQLYENLLNQNSLDLQTYLYFLLEYEYIRNRNLDTTKTGPSLFLQRVKETIDERLAQEFPEKYV